MPFALLAVPSILSGIGSFCVPASAAGLFTIGFASTTKMSIGTGALVAAGAKIGSGKLVFPIAATVLGGTAVFTENRKIKAGLAGIAALLAAGPLAGLAAPFLGAASTGTPIATLHGAALWNAALAKLGGGTLASGGGGVALGTFNVSAAGSGLGWLTGKND